MSIPFDAESKRLEYLQQLQEGSLSALRELGAVPRTSGVTRPLSAPASGLSIIDTLSNEVTRGAVAEGPRFLDRNSTDAGSTYRNTRYTYFANNYGARPYAYDETTGRRVRAGEKPTGKVRVGVNFDMDSPDAKKQWDAVFGNAISFDAVRGGEASINQPQIQALFDATIQPTEKAVDDTLAQGSVPAFTENQRLAFLDVAHNDPTLMAKVANVAKSGDPSDFVVPVMAAAVNDPTKAAKSYVQATAFIGASNAKAKLPDFSQYKSIVDLARTFIGENEKTDRSAISAFIQKTAGIKIDPASTAWCAAWLNGVLAAKGLPQARGDGSKGTVGNGMWAFDFEKYGADAKTNPQQGDIVVFRWKDGGGHVGILDHIQDGKAYVLGGNQGDSVKISAFPADQISAVRRIPAHDPANPNQIDGVPGPVAMNLDGHRLSTNIEDRRALPSVVDPAKTPQNTMFAPFRYDKDGNPLPPPVDDTGKPLRMIT